MNTNGSPSNPSTSDFDGLFSVNGWVEIAKEEDSDGGAGLDQNDVTFFSEDDNYTGTWSITQAILNQYANVAIVMKNGNSDPQPTIAYLISEISGSWETPWVKTASDGYQESNLKNSLSNVRFIGQGIGVVPLPAAGWLLLAAFGALGAATRIKKNRSAI